MISKRIGYSLLLLSFWIISIQLSAKVAIYGDTRTQDEIHQQVVNKIAGHKPVIAFHTGDLVNSGKSQAEYDKFHAISKPLTDVALLHPAKGNHEKFPILFLQNFPILEMKTYYTVIHDSLVFIVLDTTIRINVGSEQFNWLQDKLIEHDGQTILIILHHPVFSSGRHGDELGLGLYLPRVLSKYSVKAVFAGHDHGYERSYFEGIYYITTAGGGAPLYDNSSMNRHSQLWLKSYNYVIAEKAADKLLFKVYDLSDKQIDTFSVDL